MMESGSLDYDYDCAALDKARRIAEWAGVGKPLTPKGVLRPVDVHQVAGLIGVPVPAKFRSAVDVPAWHWLWCVAVDTGMVLIESNRVMAEPPLDITPELWLVAFVAAQTAVFDDGRGAGALAVARAALSVLATPGTRTRWT